MPSINEEKSETSSLRSKSPTLDLELSPARTVNCSSITISRKSSNGLPREDLLRTTAEPTQLSNEMSPESHVAVPAFTHRHPKGRTLPRMGRLLGIKSLNHDHVAPKHQKEAHTTISAITNDSPRNAVDQVMDIPIAPQAYAFPHWTTESGFCLVLCMTQFLAEYLISGFALQLPVIAAEHDGEDQGNGALWPAALLSLIMSAVLLVFARISDMYGGYKPFLFGIVWLTIWTIAPGITSSMIMLEVSRAMQGLALAAFMPSSFAILGRLYVPGPRKNWVISIYSGFAPLGFFFGFLVAGALPKDQSRWYFLTGGIISAVTSLVAYITIPRRQTDVRNRELSMDYLGASIIIAGLVLVCYGLTVGPQYGYTSRSFLGTFASGIICLILAVGIEGWVAKCPLVPFDFFKPRSVTPFSFACMCFYSCFGVWLYYSADYLQNYTVTNITSPLTLAIYYLPMAIGGLVCCAAIPILLQVVPTKLLLLTTAILWIIAPVLLIVARRPLAYWPFIFPSILCATAGINLTFTISLVFLCALQPPKFQGLCGAICSMFLGLAFAFGLPVAQITMQVVSGTNWITNGALGADTSEQQVRSMVRGFRAAFVYAAVSAGVGSVICVFWVRMPKLVKSKQSQQDDHELSGRSDGRRSEAEEAC